MTQRERERQHREIVERRKAVVLKNLSDVLAMLVDVPDEQFNMAHWWLPDGQAFDDDRNKMYKVADGPCGCVVGHMIQKGLFDSVDPSLIGPKPYVSKPVISPREEVFRVVDEALFLYNRELTKFMFDNYAYANPGRHITKTNVVRRIEFVMSEVEAW